MKNPLVSIIVPTYNSKVNITNLLDSLNKSTFKDFEVIINHDVKSTDDLEKVLPKYGFPLHYIKENYSMAQARKKGASIAKGNVLIHLDSDMLITNNLLEECVTLIDRHFDALVIPEESIGTTFWAKCKWLEKKCYEGNEHIESLRVIKKQLYDRLGGHNEKMIFSEDKDLDLRVRDAGNKIGRTKNYLLHNEGHLTLKRLLIKKTGYAKTANLFLKEHPNAAKWQANPLNRYFIFLQNWKYFFQHPLIYSGMIFMKTLEYLFAVSGYLNNL